MYVLGLRGKRGSGKDFLFTEVLSKFYGAKRYAFADELKRQVKETYNLTEEHVNGKWKEMPLFHLPVNPQDPLAKIICDYFSTKGSFAKVDGIEYWSPRLLCIAEGQFKRAVTPTYWVDFIFDKIKNDAPELAVITDVRFPESEGDGTHKIGGKVIEVKRSLERRGLSRELDDPSETAMDGWPKFDSVISNNGTADNLRLQVHNSFRRWGWTEFTWLMNKPDAQ
jgi:hypothetical protein